MAPTIVSMFHLGLRLRAILMLKSVYHQVGETESWSAMAAGNFGVKHSARENWVDDYPVFETLIPDNIISVHLRAHYKRNTSSLDGLIPIRLCRGYFPAWDSGDLAKRQAKKATNIPSTTLDITDNNLACFIVRFHDNSFVDFTFDSICYKFSELSSYGSPKIAIIAL